MNVLQFISTRKENWKQFEALIGKFKRGNDLTGSEFKQLSSLYRSAASDFAYAKTHFPEHDITAYLNKLVADSHALIYRRKKVNISSFPSWLTQKVPAIFIENIRYFYLSLGIFMLFSGVGFLGSEWMPEGEKIFLHFSITDPQESFSANASYIHMTERNIKRGRPFRVYEDDLKSIMSSSIMVNNIRVAFMCFTGGIFAGLLTFYIMASTGMMFGAFFHIFYRHDIIFDFWNTVMLHGMIELTMIVMAGAAGFMIAKGLLFPGSFTRKDSLRRMGMQAVQYAVVIGLWLVIAGILEGFITGANLIMPVKVLINLLSLIALIFYFGYLGRKASKMAKNADLRTVDHLITT